jgi:hypothetical protein
VNDDACIWHFICAICGSHSSGSFAGQALRHLRLAFPGISSRFTGQVFAKAGQALRHLRDLRLAFLGQGRSPRTTTRIPFFVHEATKGW